MTNYVISISKCVSRKERIKEMLWSRLICKKKGISMCRDLEKRKESISHIFRNIFWLCLSRACHVQKRMSSSKSYVTNTAKKWTKNCKLLVLLSKYDCPPHDSTSTTNWNTLWTRPRKYHLTCLHNPSRAFLRPGSTTDEFPGNDTDGPKEKDGGRSDD